MTSLPIISENKCGNCTACCTVMGIKQLHKLEYTPCPHICEKGCAIYDNRPSECESYMCFWRTSKLDEGLRPDQIGVILEPTITTIGMSVVMREVWPGASESAAARSFAHVVAGQLGAFIYIVRANNTRSAVFPPWAAHLEQHAKQIVYKTVQDEKREERQTRTANYARDDRRKQKKLERTNKKRNRR